MYWSGTADGDTATDPAKYDRTIADSPPVRGCAGRGLLPHRPRGHALQELAGLNGAALGAKTQCLPPRVFHILEHRSDYDGFMQLRYSFRLYPAPGQAQALTRAFGCARVVFNDALAARRAAHAAGKPYITDADMSARLTASKDAPERAWLGEVSSVVLQQALADLNAAYRNFFNSVTGKRKGAKVAPPRFRSRRDPRQSIRFTRNSRFRVLDNGRLRLPKIGDVPVRWSRPLPTEPSSVTITKDAAGRYCASFVVETGPSRLPEAESAVGIDLGLAHFAVLSDGRKIAAPQFLRRVERKLKRAQRNLARKQKGSRNRDKARIKVARSHTRVADARRNFHHQLSTAIIREKPSGRCGEPSGEGTRPHPPGQVRPRRRLGGVREHAGVQGPTVRPRVHQDRPVRADQPGLLGLRRHGRPETSARPGMDLQRLRDRP
jgi:hypothetical protein